MEMILNSSSMIFKNFHWVSVDWNNLYDQNDKCLMHKYIACKKKRKRERERDEKNSISSGIPELDYASNVSNWMKREPNIFHYKNDNRVTKTTNPNFGNCCYEFNSNADSRRYIAEGAVRVGFEHKH